MEIRLMPYPYMEDGDVVLLCEDMDEKCLRAFRVDKVFLSRHSPVFRDMFSLPNPNPREEYDGVPSVRLHDAAKDVYELLTVLYDHSVLPYEWLSSNAAEAVNGTLRVATKYQMDSLRQRIVDHLVKDWPNDLAAWDHLEAEISARFKTSPRITNSKDVPRFDSTLPEPVAVINLALQCDVPELLPASFYHLGRIPWFGQRGICGHAPIDPSYEELDYMCKGGRTANFAALSPTGYGRLYRGQQQMMAFVGKSFSLGKWVLVVGDEGCTQIGHSGRATIQGCQKAALDLGDKIQAKVLQSRDPIKIFGDFVSELKNEDPGNFSLCWHCQEELKGVLQKAREEFWQNIPKFFDLPSVADVV